MVTREINSLWKTINFFYTDCSAKNALCSLKSEVWPLLIYSHIAKSETNHLHQQHFMFIKSLHKWLGEDVLTVRFWWTTALEWRKSKPSTICLQMCCNKEIGSPPSSFKYVINEGPFIQSVNNWKQWKYNATHDRLNKYRKTIHPR